MRILPALMLLVQLSFTGACAAGAEIEPHQLRLLAPLETSGARGLTLSIPRIAGADENVRPLLQWFRPGEAISPAIYDLFPCSGLSCRHSHAVTVRVNVRRLYSDDGNVDVADAEHLVSRTREILRLAEEDRQRSQLEHKRLYPRFDASSLRVVRFPNGIWSEVSRRDSQGRLEGKVYWRLLGGAYSLSASFSTSEDTGVTVAPHFAEWFPVFVRGIGVSGTPKD